MMSSAEPADSPTPILDLTPELREKLKARNQNSLAQLLKKNSGTIFFRESGLLAQLREAGNASDDADELAFVHRFYKSVPLSTYEDYSPFISRFSETPCHATSVRDLLSPGLPDFLGQTSGTSGASFKLFPKYTHPRERITPWNVPTANTVRTCLFNTLLYYRTVDILDDEASEGVKQVLVSSVGSGLTRRKLGIGLKDDIELMSKKAPGSVTPCACWFMGKHTSGIFIKMFFAAMDPTMQMLSVYYATLLSDAVRVLETHWEVVVDAIEAGIVPDVYDLDHFRPYLEMYVKPNPERAAELRAIEKGKEGWLNQVWPELAVIRTSASGVYAAPVPKIRYHFGPKVVIESKNYVSTECAVGWGYTSSDLNLYRLDYFEHIEFIDIEARERADLLQAWELQSGKKYEVVVTTHDGLWRYQLKDIIEVAGFDPRDGQPLVRFSSRSGVGFRLSGEFVPESMLQDAISSLTNTLGHVSEFTSAVDNRKAARGYGFFVELDGELGANAQEAPKALKEYLFRNFGYKTWSVAGYIGDPTIRIVAPGTFQNYRDWKVATTGTGVGQVKVPITTMDGATVEWLTERVVSEVGV